MAAGALAVPGASAAIRMTQRATTVVNDIHLSDEGATLAADVVSMMSGISGTPLGQIFLHCYKSYRQARSWQTAALACILLVVLLIAALVLLSLHPEWLDLKFFMAVMILGPAATYQPLAVAPIHCKVHIGLHPTRPTVALKLGRHCLLA